MKDAEQAYCKLCTNSFLVAIHGRTSLSLHAAGVKHKARVPSVHQRSLVPLSKSVQEKTKKETKTNTFCSALFDESLNHMVREEQMNISIRYWCEESCIVKTQYSNS